MTGFAANPLSRRMVWQFVQGAWPGLEMQLAGSSNLGKVVQVAFQSFVSSSPSTSWIR